MTDKSFSDELERALARVDSAAMARTIDNYVVHFATGARDWPDEHADDFFDVGASHWDDPEKALAYVVIGASRTDEPRFLSFLACGPLEDILRDPSTNLLDRIVAEARKSARFRWMLDHPYKVAIAPRAWEAIKIFRTTGPHEEPPAEALPAR